MRIVILVCGFCFKNFFIIGLWRCGCVCVGLCVSLCIYVFLSLYAVSWCRFARWIFAKSIFLRTLKDKPLTIWLSKLMRKWSMSADAFKLWIKGENGIFRVFLNIFFLVLFVFVTINVCLIQIQCMLDSCIVDNQHRIDLCYRPHICGRLKLWDWMLIAWKAFVWSKIYWNVMNSSEMVKKTSPICQFQESLPSTIRRNVLCQKPCFDQYIHAWPKQRFMVHTSKCFILPQNSKRKRKKTDSVLKWPQNVHFKNTLKWCAECDNINQNVCKFEMCSNDTGFWCPKRTQLESFVSEDKSTRIFGTLNSHWISYHRETNNKQPSIYQPEGDRREQISVRQNVCTMFNVQCSQFKIKTQSTPSKWYNVCGHIGPA